jgi:hypothetical protein
VIDPCGNPPGTGQQALDEVLLRLRNGQIIAHYSSGQKQFLVIVPPGYYSTTDGYSCSFQVLNDGSVTW